MQFDSIHTLHVEPTTLCNAACPQCARETDPAFDSQNIHHLTVEQLKVLVPEYVLKKLQKVYFCGVYGDPAAGKYTVELAKFFRFHNPTVILGMNTNGSLQNTQWWSDLATLWHQPQDYVVFSIDGLADTNHIYRRNTVWSKLMENSQAFIDNNGSAHWDMLLFEHNQHQVSEILSLAKSMGFKWFRNKVSKRFVTHSVVWLKPPKNSAVENTINDQVLCQASQENSLYISAQGKIHACCWMAAKNQDISHWLGHDFSHSVCQNNCRNQFQNQWKKEVQL